MMHMLISLAYLVTFLTFRVSYGYLELNPPKAVVRFGDPVSVNCSTSTEHYGMGWEAPAGSLERRDDVDVITWTVPELTDWDIEPICFINTDDGQHNKTLSIIVYKTPDSVSISYVNHTGPVMEKTQYELQCDIKNIAPLQYLTVRWYKGQTLVDSQIFTDDSKTPVNVSVPLLITPSRADDGAQYWCEAELDLGAEGPQPPPTVQAETLNVEVCYPPSIVSLPSDKGVIELGDAGITLNCTAIGNPAPVYSWNSTLLQEKTDQPTITSASLRPGNYTCSASNKLGRVWKHFSVKAKPRASPGHPSSTQPRPLRRGDRGQYTQVIRGAKIINRTVAVSVTLQLDLLSSKQCEEENIDGVSRLYINKASGYNIGNYTCIATNKFGNTSSSARVLVRGAETLCPLQLNQSSIVVKHNEPFSVNCSLPSGATGEITWMLSNREIHSSVFESGNFHWNDTIMCSATIVGLGQCHKNASVTVYKTPDSVSISYVNHTGPVMEKTQYELQCDIKNIAPVQYLSVRWYKGQTLVDSQTFTDDSKTPVSVSVPLLITPSRADDGAQYRCEAELDLGAEGPQPPPVVKSETLNITVHYAPVINTTKLPSVVPVIRGYSENLICEADGSPPPEIVWMRDNKIIVNDSNLVITNARAESVGFYICNASNMHGSNSTTVKVVLKEDYLPLIAGFVAIMVAVIIVGFTIIFSIYYKNTKMGHYSLKNAKPNPQNGNIAQNGKENTLPMTKLSLPQSVNPA
ncbi:hemicentin-1-like [Chanos chanos]|uniref:Hemicentin-1-like n=1 Tax=Chanos chanos TaxID=29144 RepID=A0A6J2WJ77_CHACN|nr:hemicentin-1-like [Chanos chanos]